MRYLITTIFLTVFITTAYPADNSRCHGGMCKKYKTLSTVEFSGGTDISFESVNSISTPVGVIVLSRTDSRADLFMAAKQSTLAEQWFETHSEMKAFVRTLCGKNFQPQTAIAQVVESAIKITKYSFTPEQLAQLPQIKTQNISFSYLVDETEQIVNAHVQCL